MKETHRFRTAAILLLAVLLSLTLPTLAVFGATPSEDADTPAVTTAAADGATAIEPAATIGGAIGDFLRENFEGLLSGATLAVTLVASLVLRRKILPPLIEALSTLLGKSREAASAITEGNETTQRIVGSMLARTEEMLAEARAAADRAEESARTLAAEWGDKATIARVLTEQSTLLYELLMSANLPQYEKDRIGEVHAAILRALEVQGN